MYPDPSPRPWVQEQRLQARSWSFPKNVLGKTVKMVKKLDNTRSTDTIKKINISIPDIKEGNMLCYDRK